MARMGVWIGGSSAVPVTWTSGRARGARRRGRRAGGPGRAGDRPAARPGKRPTRHGGVLRAHARGGAPRARAPAARRPAHRRARHARGQGGRDGHRRGQDPGGRGAGRAQRPHGPRVHVLTDNNDLAGATPGGWGRYTSGWASPPARARGAPPKRGSGPTARRHVVTVKEAGFDICARPVPRKNRPGPPALSSRPGGRGRLAPDRRGAHPAGDRRQRSTSRRRTFRAWPTPPGAGRAASTILIDETPGTSSSPTQGVETVEALLPCANLFAAEKCASRRAAQRPARQGAAAPRRRLHRARRPRRAGGRAAPAGWPRTASGPTACRPPSKPRRGCSSSRREDPRLARIQLLLEKYPRLCGMTGTARPRPELASSTGSRIAVPTHRPLIRVDQPDVSSPAARRSGRPC